MSTSLFKKTVFFSLLGHIAVLSVFSLSFDTEVGRGSPCDVLFFGSFLKNHDMVRLAPFPGLSAKAIPVNSPIALPAPAENTTKESLSERYSKPSVSLAYLDVKPVFRPHAGNTYHLLTRREQAIMLYPKLPYQASLYFKDRQTIHIELMFNIMSSENKNLIIIKRKISSGNLEADLLSMRYISHYLFIQQTGFTPESWQVVKVDLSTKND